MCKPLAASCAVCYSQTRVAANRAYLRGLGLGPSAIQSGLINSLPPDHMAMVAAARQIAKQAAIKRAEQQVRHSIYRSQSIVRHRLKCIVAGCVGKGREN